MDFNAAEILSFVQNQTTVLNREVNETEFPEIIYPELVPVLSEGNPFAQSVTYISTTQAGQADWIQGDSDDIPMADVGLAQQSKPVYTAAIGYGFGWEEISIAQQLGYNLDAMKAIAARRAYEQMVNRVVLEGDTTKGFKGLSDQTIWQSAGATLSDWTDLNSVVDTTVSKNINDTLMTTSNAGGVPAADTLLVPVAYYTALYSRYIPNARENLLSYVTNNNVYTAQTGRPLVIRALSSLSNAIVAYRNSPDVLAVHIPMPHRFLPVHQAGPLRWEVPGVFRMGGLNVRRTEDTAILTT